MNVFKNTGQTRTDLYCHHCGKNFIALIDFSLNAQFLIICPICNHEHYRTVKNGIVTGDRWNSASNTIKIEKRHIWKHDTLPIQTSTVSHFLREKWMNKKVG